MSERVLIHSSYLIRLQGKVTIMNESSSYTCRECGQRVTAGLLETPADTARLRAAQVCFACDYWWGKLALGYHSFGFREETTDWEGTFLPHEDY